MELKMNVEVKTNVDVEIHIEDIAEKINMIPIKNRWNFISTLINEIDVEETELLDNDHLEMIGNYLLQNSNRLLEARQKKFNF